MGETGHLAPMPPEWWRTAPSGHALLFGATAAPGTAEAPGAALFVEEHPFMDWLFARPPGAARPARDPASLPEWLTLMETLAWIMLRDADAVLWASRDAKEAGYVASEFWQGWDGIPPGEGVTMPTLAIRWGREGRGPDAQGAKAELLNRLRDATLPSSQCTTNSAELRAIPAHAWRGMLLTARPGDDREIVGRPSVPGNIWPEPQLDGVLVQRDRVLRLWRMPLPPASLSAPSGNASERIRAGEGASHPVAAHSSHASTWMTADEAADHWIAVHSLEPNDVAAQRAVAALVEAWSASTLVVIGIPDREAGKPDPDAKPEKVPPELFTLAALILRNNRLERGAAGTIEDSMLARRPLYSNLKMKRAEVERLWPLGIKALERSAPPFKRRLVRGVDYTEADGPLVKKMREMVESGTARNPTDAARALARQASGSATEPSKVARLLKRYAERYPSSSVRP